MKLADTIKIYATILFILIMFLSESVAQENPVEPEVNKTIGLTGKVVDVEGKPMPNFTFSIRSTDNPEMVFPQGIMIPPHIMNQQGMPHQMAQVKTDAKGNFSTSNIRPGYLYINPVSEKKLNAIQGMDPNNQKLAEQIRMDMIQFEGLQSKYQILSIRLNNVTFFYTHEGPPHLRGLSFQLKPGTNIENVKITVKKRLKIRAQIVYADGTPVANIQADLTMRHNGREFGGGGGTHGTDCYTDAEGYFTEYREEPGYYTLTVEFKGFSGGAGPFLLKKDVHPENIVIKLDGNPAKPKRPTGDNKEIDNEKARDIVNKLLNQKNRVWVVRTEVGIPNIHPQAKSQKLVWIINPANGHAYAKISCGDWHDAQQKAIKEDAHLVSINDEDEQFWIETIFGRSGYWIGLNDVEKEGIWQWDSGEPVTYTNWSTREMFPDNSPDTEKDFVATVPIFEGGWQATSPKGHLWQFSRTAIIEQDGLVSKIPKPQEETEEE